MKRLCLLSCVLCLLLCGCNTSNDSLLSDTANDSLLSVESVEVDEPVTVNMSDYEEILFKDLPDSVDEQISTSGKVCITGYLTDEISYDKSTGYLSNSGHGSMLTEVVYGKCIVLDLNSVNVDGGQYVTVFGDLITEDYYDIYNIKSSWYVKVNAIQPVNKIPDGVKQYDDFVESYEFEALANVINFIGNCAYSWHSETDVTVERVECDYDSLLQGTMNNYNLVYTTIGEQIRTLGDTYKEVLNYFDNEEVPENAEEFYNSFIECYELLTQNLEIVGLFE